MDFWLFPFRLHKGIIQVQENLHRKPVYFLTRPIPVIFAYLCSTYFHIHIIPNSQVLQTVDFEGDFGRIDEYVNKGISTLSLKAIDLQEIREKEMLKVIN